MSASGSAPIRLTASPRRHTDDGGFRSVHPRATYETYAHLISGVTGAVTHVEPMPKRDTPLRAVYTSAYRVSSSGTGGRPLDFLRPCAGKGMTSEQARASALCEALERYSGVYQGDEARVRGSFRDLAPRAIHPDVLQQFSAGQQRDARAAREIEPHRWVPRPFEEARVIDWTPAWSLTHEPSRLVPLAYCYSEAPSGADLDYCRNNANGTAAGNNLEEAILQGLLELVERDAAAVWWYNRLRRPQFDLESLGDAYIGSLRSDYARLGWRVWALDLTHDLKIPASVAVARHVETQRVFIGFGCHLSRLIAVQRSLTELNQLFLPEDSNGGIEGLDELSDLSFLLPNAELPCTDLVEAESLGAGNLKSDVEACVQRCADAGLEVCVVNKTRPDVGLSVAQAIVPGLRHFWPRFAGGRLYDVPVQLGWLERAKREVELNPVPLYL